MKVNNFTKRDIDILNVLARSDAPMSASEIVAADDSLGKNTVQAELRKLLKSGYIEVSDIAYSGTVLCRRYSLTDKASPALMEQITDSFRGFTERLSIPSLVSYFLKNIDDQEQLKKDISELDNIISEYKRRLK